MLLADKQRQPPPRILPDRAEATTRVAVPEVGHPAAQEHVHVLRDRLWRQRQPTPAGQFPDPAAGPARPPSLPRARWRAAASGAAGHRLVPPPLASTCHAVSP